MAIAKYTITEAVQAIQLLDFIEDTCNINQYIAKRMQNNGISEVINMEKQDIAKVRTQQQQMQAWYMQKVKNKRGSGK